MSRCTLLVEDPALRRSLQAALRDCSSWQVLDPAKLDLAQIEDLAFVAAAVRFNPPADHRGALGRAFPSMRSRNGTLPRWIPTFHVVEGAGAAGDPQGNCPVAPSAETLAALLRDWAAVTAARRGAPDLRRRLLHEEHGDSIGVARMPHGTGGDPGEDMIYILGGTPYWTSVRRQIQEAAESDRPVLLQGDTGAGKEVVARIIATLYLQWTGKTGKFVAVNASVLSPELRELTGIERGVASAVDRRDGIFYEARDGVLFLDEVATLNGAVQPQLLRVLSSGDFQPAGGRVHQWRDKLISATNQPIQDDDKFRPDLLQRLKAHHIHLRSYAELDAEDKRVLNRGVTLCTLMQIERAWGIPEGRHLLEITEMGLTKLLVWDYTGSIREIKQIIHTAAERALQRGFVIDSDCFPERLGTRFDIEKLRPWRDEGALLPRIFEVSAEVGVKPQKLMLRLAIDHLKKSGDPAASSQDRLAKKIGIGKDQVGGLLREPKLAPAVERFWQTVPDARAQAQEEARAAFLQEEGTLLERSVGALGDVPLDPTGTG